MSRIFFELTFSLKSSSLSSWHIYYNIRSTARYEPCLIMRGHSLNRGVFQAFAMFHLFAAFLKNIVYKFVALAPSSTISAFC